MRDLPYQLEEIHDRFATVAMQSILSHFDYGALGLTKERMTKIAIEAYEMADAMIEARNYETRS